MPQTRAQWAVAGAVVAVVVALFGVLIWFMVQIQPADRNASGSVSYQLQPGTGVSDLANQLEEKGIIRNHSAFIWYVTLRGLRSGLQAGMYELNPSDSTAEIADILGHGRISVNKLVVPEGSSVASVRALAQDKGITNEQFNEALAASYANDFLAGRPEGDSSLEGYLFPDSYQVIKPPRPKALIQAMLDNFASKVKSTDIVTSYAQEGMTLHQGVTLASIVQKEGAKPADQAAIAGVFFNRLKAGMTLSSDVTVIYAANLLNQPFDVNLNSPYNTYNHKGLPPGPICNPGLDALKAVAHPTPSDYLYFLADKQGNIHYAKTAAEHQANVDKYLK